MELLSWAFIGTPFLVGATWWKWLETRRQQPSPPSRVAAVLVGAIAATVNAALFYGCVVYAWKVTPEAASELRNTLGNFVAIPLFFLALAGAVLGQGRAARILLAVTALAGMLNWIPVGVL